MKRIILMVLVVLVPSVLFAADNTCRSNVTMSLSAQQWLKMESAQVTINVNASASGQQLAVFKADILGKLSKLASGVEWHIVSLKQSEDQSGLMSVNAAAQARLPMADVDKLNAGVKQISKAGLKFTVGNVSYTPAESQVESAQNALRKVIYQKTNAQLKELNDAFTNQHYFMKTIYFDSVPKIMPLMAAGMSYRENNKRQMPVNMKLTMSARVEFAADCKSDS